MSVACTIRREEVGPDRRAGRSFCPVTTRTARRSVPTIFTGEGGVRGKKTPGENPRSAGTQRNPTTPRASRL